MIYNLLIKRVIYIFVLVYANWCLRQILWKNRGPIIGPLVGAYAGKKGALGVWAGRKNRLKWEVFIVGKHTGDAGIKKLSDDL